MEIFPVEAELFHADGQTDRHDEANSRFSQFCEGAWKSDPAWGLAVGYCEEDEGPSSVNFGVFLYHLNYF